MIFVNKYGFVSVINFLMICEKHSYLQLNLNSAVNNFTGMLLFIIIIIKYLTIIKISYH